MEFLVSFRTRLREEDEGMNVLALKSVIDHHMANLLPTASHRLISQGEEMSDHRSILDYALRHGLILEENSGQVLVSFFVSRSSFFPLLRIKFEFWFLEVFYTIPKSGEKEKSSGMGSFSSRELVSGRVMKPFGPLADDLLRVKDYSVFANFLDGQLLTPNTARLTIFAPNDKAIRAANQNNLSSIFKQHVFPQRFLWEEVAALVNGGKLETFHASVIDVDELISGDLLAEPNYGIKSVLPFPKKLQVIDLFEDANAGASGN